MGRKPRTAKDPVQPTLSSKELEVMLALEHGFLDYLTLEFDDTDTVGKGIYWFLQYASEVVYDKETGAAIGNRIPLWCFAKNSRVELDKVTREVLSIRWFVQLFAGGQWEGVRLCDMYHLRVVRMDVSVNVHIPKPIQFFERCRLQAREWVLSFPDKAGRAQILDIAGKSKGSKGDRGFAITDASGDHRFSLYRRTDMEENPNFPDRKIPVRESDGYLRLEYQLRGGDLVAALEVLFDAERGIYDFYNTAKCKEVFDLTYNKWHGHIRLLDDGGSIEGLIPYVNLCEGVLSTAKKEKTTDPDTYLNWILDVIAPSIYNRYKTTGVDVRQHIESYFMQHLEADNTLAEHKRLARLTSPYEKLAKQMRGKALGQINRSKERKIVSKSRKQHEATQMADIRKQSTVEIGDEPF